MQADVSATHPAPDDRSGAQEGAGVAVYGARYYSTYTGGPYEYEGQWKEWFGNVADRLIRQFNPRTVLDAGCAKGFLVAALRERGVEAYGIDYSDYAVANAPEAVRPYVKVGSITDPIEGRFDLITCIEVIEHLPRPELNKAVAALCQATDRLVLSSTGEGEHFGEPSHLSLQSPENWTALFAHDDFFRNHGEDVSWLAPWAMVLERRPAMTVAEVVREYDRQAAQDQREIFELRRTALRLEHEIEAADQPDTSMVTRRLEQLEAREQEVAATLTQTLRLRDLLIVNERALGIAQGEIAQLHDQLAGHGDLVRAHDALVNSTTWRIAWKVLTPYRNARHRLGR